MSIEANISLALGIATDNLLNGLGYAGLIDYPDLPFTVPDEPTFYFEVRHFRNTPDAPGWGTQTLFAGIWQISLIDFRQLGDIPAMTILTPISDTFAKNAEFWSGTTRVSVDKAPAILSVIQEGHKAIYPLSIRYRATG